LGLTKGSYLILFDGVKRTSPTRSGHLPGVRRGVAADEISPWVDLEWAAAQLPLEEFLSFRLTRLASGVQAGLSRYYAENYELTVPEWRTLAALARYAPINFGQLLALSTFDKSLISRAVTSLRNKRLASSRADPEHGKRVIVNITKAGRAIYAKILPQARARQVALLSHFSPKERANLYQVLKKLQTLLGQDPPAS
jgi:DNA-binding MarR family transcriptional regulator